MTQLELYFRLVNMTVVMTVVSGVRQRWGDQLAKYCKEIIISSGEERDLSATIEWKLLEVSKEQRSKVAVSFFKNPR